MPYKKPLTRKSTKKTAKTRQTKGRASAVAKARAQPSKAVKNYVKTMVDRAIPDQTFFYRSTLSLPTSGAPLIAPIFGTNATDFGVAPYDATMINLNFPKLYMTRNDSGYFPMNELFPRLKIKLKSIRISGQVALAGLAGGTVGTKWAKVHIIAYEPRSYDQHQCQDLVSYNDCSVPETNILMDRRRTGTQDDWLDDDCSFTPAGGYTQECASFNTSGFKMLGATNVMLYNSTDKPGHNLKKFSLSIKCPQYLNYRQKDSSMFSTSNDQAPSDPTQRGPIPPSNFFPIVAAYAVFENGSTQAVDLQLDTSIRVEPVQK